MDVLRLIITAALLLAVILLVITRPKDLNIAWPAGLGAVIVLLLGLLPLADLSTIVQDTWDATVTLISLFLLSDALDSNGFFNWSALYLARVARGSGKLLYCLILLLTLAVVGLLANDGAVLMLTPIFAQLLKKIYPRTEISLPFILATGLFADAMSIIFIPSNLTNIIIADANQMNFLNFAGWMIIPTLLVFIAGFLTFAVRFRTQISKTYDINTLENPSLAIVNKKIFWCGWVALAILAIGYIIGSRFHLPFSFISGPIALSMLLLIHFAKVRPVGEILRQAPWTILIYALGMFVVITAAYQAGILSFLINPLIKSVSDGPVGSLYAEILTSILSASVNNLPATLISVLALHHAQNIDQTAIFAIIVGVNIGPKFTPFGSLATLLWLDILKKNDITISWGTYIKQNWYIVCIMLAAAFGGILLTMSIINLASL